MATGKYFMPPEMPSVGGPEGPYDKMIFLAGPIKGAPAWHDDAVRIIREMDTEVHIASPAPPRVEGREFTEEMYLAQIGWEHNWLNYCAKYGVTLFWLVNEQKHYCERAYGQTSRYELGMQSMRAEILGARLVVGMDNNFSNGKYLRNTIPQLTPSVPKICDTLQETCEKAIELVGTL